MVISDIVPAEVKAIAEKADTVENDELRDELFANFQQASFIGTESARPSVFHFMYWREWSPGCPVCGVKLKDSSRPADLHVHSEKPHKMEDGKDKVTVQFHIIKRTKK